MESFRGDSQALAPLDQGQRFATEFDQTVLASVAGVLLACYPAAVVRFIVAVIVDPIQGVFWSWWLSHVVEKCLERLAPTFTDPDSASAVVGIAAVVGVFAAGNHAGPALIQGMGSQAMRTISGNEFLAPHASAIGRIAGSERWRPNESDVPAIASARPVRLATKPDVTADDSPLAEALFAEVDKMGHEANSSRIGVVFRAVLAFAAQGRLAHCMSRSSAEVAWLDGPDCLAMATDHIQRLLGRKAAKR